jgi:hypothetical protein
VEKFFHLLALPRSIFLRKVVESLFDLKRIFRVFPPTQLDKSLSFNYTNTKRVTDTAENFPPRGCKIKEMNNEWKSSPPQRTGDSLNYAIIADCADSQTHSRHESSLDSISSHMAVRRAFIIQQHAVAETITRISNVCLFMASDFDVASPPLPRLYARSHMRWFLFRCFMFILFRE